MGLLIGYLVLIFVCEVFAGEKDYVSVAIKFGGGVTS